MTCGLLAGRLVVEARVARTHLAITVELVHGMHTGDLWPRPGRVLIARTATFEQLSKAIDDVFARWITNTCTSSPWPTEPRSSWSAGGTARIR